LVSLSGPSSTPITVNFSTADGTAIQGTDYAAASGQLTFAPGQTNMRVLVSPVDEGDSKPSDTFYVNLANATGATIANSQGAVTIQSNPTKFFVVNVDPVQDRTYKYQSNGAAIVSNWLNFNNTSPRGVAANSTGTTTWVVDANKNVYVYDSRNVLLGSWSAGGLSSSAALTGIATNGTDIWLVDSYSDKVYKYTGAASLLSGSQSAASSFSLAGGKHGDTNPQDIVTDGTSFWVVDGSRLKVFKYTLSGSLLGSWAIDPANTQPTGITINPNNVSDIWIVDNGTDKVYQYIGAASRTSGSQNAGATFALAAGNTNPQGIADPPTADLLISSAPAPALPELPSIALFTIASSRGPSAIAGVPSLAGQDAVFALAVREAFPKSGEPSVDLTAPGDSPALVADQSLTRANTFGGQQSIDSLAPLARGSHGFRSERSAVGLLDGVLIGEENPASAVGTDSFFALLAADAAGE
jgi:hypothetical protein